MHSSNWSGAPPPQQGQFRDSYNETSNQQNQQGQQTVYDVADQITRDFRNFSLREYESHQQHIQGQQYPQHNQQRRSLSSSQSSLGDSRTGPYPIHGDGESFPPASPAMSDSRSMPLLDGFSSHANWFNYRPFDTSSTASTLAPQSNRASVQSSPGLHNVPGRQYSIRSNTSGRAPPRPIDYTSHYSDIDALYTSPEPVVAQPVRPRFPSLGSQVPPQIPPKIPSRIPSPSATPPPPTPEDKYGQPPEMLLSPGRPPPAVLNYSQPVRPSVHSPIQPQASGHGMSPPMPTRGQHTQHSLLSPTVPTAPTMKPVARGATNGVGRYIPSPAPSPQPPRSVPAMTPYNPPNFLAPRGPGGPASSVCSLSPHHPAKHYFAIGIDFGTTYSGVSWAYSGNPSNIHDVQQYPSSADYHKSRDEAQVPTLLDFKSHNWGFLIEGSDDPMRWFKLLLLNDADIPRDIANSEYLRATREKTKNLGDDGPIQLVAIFLKELWETALREIAREVKQPYLDSMPIKVALTVPAIWPGYAKDSMKRAARNAGILDMRDAGETELILVQEPEAAALSTLMERREYPDMKDGETFMVVDCGGGTIDVISYKVLSIRPFRVREVVGGAGKLCGAFMIDDKFVDHMKRKTPFKFENCSLEEWRQFVYSEWEHALKRNFTYGPSQLAEVRMTPPFQAIPAYLRITPLRLAPKKVVLSRDVVNGFFEETYQGIHSLVQEQYYAILRAERGTPPRNIVLVGGLGSSNYLLKRLQEAFSNIVQPQRSWSAVARGAVVAILRNYNLPQDMKENPDLQNDFSTLPEVASRIARLSYGVKTGIPVSQAAPRVDRALDQFYNQHGEEQRVWRMKWFVKKGEKLDNRDPVSHKFYELVNDPKTTSTRFEIFVSGADTPPVRLDETCSLLCTLTCQYDTPFDSLRIINPKMGLRVVDDMRLTMRFGAEPEWRLQVGRHDVKEKVNVEFQMA